MAIGATVCTRPVHGRHFSCAGQSQLLKIALGRPVAQGLMRSDGVVHLLPGQELPIELWYRPVQVPDFVELLGVGPLGAFYRAVELGGAGRQDEEADAPLLPSLLELGLE